jgi:hypothetical protein
MKHIILTNTVEEAPYKSMGFNGAKKDVPFRDPKIHADNLKALLDDACEKAGIQGKGAYLVFSGCKGYDLAVYSLESIKNGMRLLNVKKEDGVTSAIVYVPEGKEEDILRKIEEYKSNQTEAGKPLNNNLLASIEDVKAAELKDFCTGSADGIPEDEPICCEAWFCVSNGDYKGVDDAANDACEILRIKRGDDNFPFPDRLVKTVFANLNQLAELISASPSIAEIREAETIAESPIGVCSAELGESVQHLKDRTSHDFSNAAICILDTGVNSGHPLLYDSIAKNSAISTDEEWGSGDEDGHGTAMAGIALYGDLQSKLMTKDSVVLRHRIESVKMLPSIKGAVLGLYGSFIRKAVMMAEELNLGCERVYCMPLTSSNFNDGSPTSWSAAIDSLSFGQNGEGKRLFIVGAGDATLEEFKELRPSKAGNRVKSPAQAWNALTVGDYEDICSCAINIGRSKDAADSQDSQMYDWRLKGPIKPDIVWDCRGSGINGAPSQSSLTSYFKPQEHLLASLSGSSRAVALTAHAIALLMIEYPKRNPETLRGLMVHSASWPNGLLEKLRLPDTKSIGRRISLRTFGYGIPDMAKALSSKTNDVTMIIEAVIQPYAKKGMNAMHMHKVPWPKEQLRAMGDSLVTMRLTLSYYIEPGPGEIGWRNKYRYPSCGLRFDVINHNESKWDFGKRINAILRDGPKDSGEGTSGSEHWHLGSNNRDAGSVHSDFRTQSAADLCDAQYIAVFPVVGWWRERTHLGLYNENVRYSLIVSISAHRSDVDFYSPILAQ